MHRSFYFKGLFGHKGRITPMNKRLIDLVVDSEIFALMDLFQEGSCLVEELNI